MLNQDLIKTVQHFYICTNLPISILSSRGDVLIAYGNTPSFKKLFHSNAIADQVLTHNFESDSCDYTLFPCPESIHYTALPIDPHAPEIGFFVMGPHTCQPNHTLSIPYKPKCLIGNLVALLHNIQHTCHTPSAHIGNHIYHVNRAMDFMHRHYHRNFTLNELCDYLKLSKPYLCKLIKRETGETFSSLLNEIRVKKSQSLLLQKDWSILDIALSSGFNNQNYYNITFKKITGMTPQVYRNTHKKR